MNTEQFMEYWKLDVVELSHALSLWVLSPHSLFFHHSKLMDFLKYHRIQNANNNQRKFLLKLSFPQISGFDFHPIYADYWTSECIIISRYVWCTVVWMCDWFCSFEYFLYGFRFAMRIERRRNKKEKKTTIKLRWETNLFMRRFE